MLPTLLRFGWLEVHAYGLLVALGFLAGIAVTLYYARRENIGPQQMLDLAIMVIISSIVGARLFYVAGQFGYYRSHPLEIVMVQNGGLVFLGGLLLSLAVVWYYARRQGIPLLKLFDAIAPGTALGYAIGRIGCFLNGCCFGLPTKQPWGVVFPNGSLAASFCPGQPLEPTQLYSSALMLAACLALVWLYRRKSFDGQILCCGLVFYSLYRFLIEFLRFSPVHWLSLTPSQWLVVPLFVFGLWGLYRFGRAG